MIQSIRMQHLCSGLALLILFAMPAAAQSPEDAILDGDTGSVGLLEKKPTEKPVLDDPDAKQLEALSKRRAGLETFINAFQEQFIKERVLEVKLGKKLAKISGQFDKVTTDALKAGDAFAVAHNPVLAEYRSALQEDRGPDIKKAAKAIEKLRKSYDKTLSKLEKRVTRIKGDFAKIEPALKAAEAEEAEPDEPEEEE